MHGLDIGVIFELLYKIKKILLPVVFDVYRAFHLQLGFHPTFFIAKCKAKSKHKNTFISS
jgi:hypothetical protein